MTCLWCLRYVNRTTRNVRAAQVPLRLSVVVDGEPLIVPLWFFYQEGVLWCACQRDSYLVRSLAEQEAETRKDLVCAFDVSTNTAPIGVAGKAHLSLHMNRGSDRLRLLVEKYLQDPRSSFAEWLLARAEDEVALCLRPIKVRAWDFTKRMSG